MQPLPGGDEARAGALDLLDARGNDTSLEVDLVLSGVGVDLPEDDERLLEATVTKEVPRRLGQEMHQADLEDLRAPTGQHIDARYAQCDDSRGEQRRVRPCNAIHGQRLGRPVNGEGQPRGEVEQPSPELTRLRRYATTCPNVIATTLSVTRRPRMAVGASSPM